MVIYVILQICKLQTLLFLFNLLSADFLKDLNTSVAALGPCQHQHFKTGKCCSLSLDTCNNCNITERMDGRVLNSTVPQHNGKETVPVKVKGESGSILCRLFIIRIDMTI